MENAKRCAVLCYGTVLAAIDGRLGDDPHHQTYKNPRAWFSYSSCFDGKPKSETATEESPIITHVSPLGLARLIASAATCGVATPLAKNYRVSIISYIPCGLTRSGMRR